MKYRISDVFDLQMGKTPDRNKTEYWNDGTEPWISIADMSKADIYIGSTKECISNLAVEKSGIKIIPRNTVIMSFKLSIGKVAITERDMYSNEAIMAFIDKGVVQIIPEYLYYSLLSKDWNEGTNKAVMGKTLNKATLSQMKIVIHGFDEQRMITEKLHRLGDVIAQRRKQLELLDAIIKARFVEMFGDPVSNPMGWEKRPLADLANIKIGPFGSLLHKDDYIEGGHPLVNPSHIQDGQIVTDKRLTISDEKFEELSAYKLEVGDVVLGRRGEMGRCAVVTEDGLLCGTGSLLIRTNGEVTADYIQKIISFPSFKRTIEDMAVGQTMPNLNVPIVSGFKIACPDKETQSKYYAFVSEVDKSKFVGSPRPEFGDIASVGEEITPKLKLAGEPAAGIW